MQATTAFGVLLLLISAATLSFAAYALLRGGRGQRGPISERGIHVIAGVRMLLIGMASLVAGAYLLLG